MAKRRQSEWNMAIIGVILAVVAYLVNVAATRYYGKPTKPFLRPFIFLEIAVLLFLSVIQDLKRGQIKMGRYGPQVKYDRTTISYWVYIAIALGFAAFCAFQAWRLFYNPQQ